MAFWDFFRKKEKPNTEEEFLDPELNLEREFARRKRDEEYDHIEQMQYIRTQCDQVVESSKYIGTLKEEYQSVSNYLMDIQKIDTAAPATRNTLRSLAKDATTLDARREKYKKKKNNLPYERFLIYERYQDDFPEALTNFQNDEKYQQTVKHDMRILEAEKVSLKEEIANSAKKRVTVRNTAWVLLFMLLAVLAVFFITGAIRYSEGVVVLLVILGACTLLEIFLVIQMSNSARRKIIAEKQLNRAITLLNKTKIKFVNISNSVEYQKTKFSVANGYQLSHEYELYLMDAKAMERYQDSARELDATIVAINQILKSLELYDVGVWESQLEALADDKEMVEIRHSLNARRQKLREQIDFNMGRIEDAKKSVIAFMKSHPQIASAIMEIVDSYDMDME